MYMTLSEKKKTGWQNYCCVAVKMPTFDNPMVCLPGTCSLFFISISSLCTYIPVTYMS